MLSRRTALTLGTGGVPAWAQSRNSGGHTVPNPVVFFEIGCQDRAKAERFFGDLFGWKIQSGGASSPVNTGSDKGIQGHINSLGHEPRHYAMFYVEVDDVKAYLDKAVALGGKTLVPPIKIPTGTFAWFADLDGNTIGLLKSDRP